MNARTTHTGSPQLPPMQLDEDFQHFRRVQVHEPLAPVRDIEDAYRRLDAESGDPAAHAFIGVQLFLGFLEEGTGDNSSLELSREHLSAAITIGNHRPNSNRIT